MKIKDYIRLAKINLNARKKNTRRATLGIFTSMTLLLFVLFVLFGFFFSIRSNYEENPVLYGTKFDLVSGKLTDSYVNKVSAEYEEDIKNIKAVEDYISYKIYHLHDESSSEKTFSFSIDSKEYKLDKPISRAGLYPDDNKEVRLVFNFINVEESSNIFLKSDYYVSNNNPLLYGRSFNAESKNEIMINSAFFKDYDLEPQEYIGKKITLSKTIESDNFASKEKDVILNGSTLNHFRKLRGKKLNICSDFEIVGIFNDDIYKSDLRRTENDYSTRTYFWFPDKALEDNGETFIPQAIEYFGRPLVSNQSLNGYYYYDADPIEMADNAKNAGMVFLPLGFLAYNSQIINPLDKYLLVQFDTFKGLLNNVDYINGLYRNSSTYEGAVFVHTFYLQPLFEDIVPLYKLLSILIIIFSFFGLFIFLVTLMDLINTFVHNINLRSKYLGMLNAIGLTKKGIKKLYFIELLIIFRRATILTTIFGGIICSSFLVFYNILLITTNKYIYSGIDPKLHFRYIVLALVMVIIICFIISSLISIFTTKKIKNNSALKLLKKG